MTDRPLPQPPCGPAPTPAAATPADHLTPTLLATLGFHGYTVMGSACILPPLCVVPGGVFSMGTDTAKDTQAFEYDARQYPIQVDSFSIAQHPVTVAEYACAVDAKAVREPPQSGEVTWQQQLLRSDHPVVCISWQDAVAYAGWLAQITGQPWSLPTEAEWEKAARWDAQLQVSHIYPWGDTFDQSRCNTAERKAGRTVPVGSYPAGASPCGAQDMAGHIWEWTSSLLKPYPYMHSDGRENADSNENRVLRGGSWVDEARYTRAAFRFPGMPDDVFINIGFRLVVSAPSGS